MMPILFHSNDYQNINPNSQKAVFSPIIRQQVVLLTKQLLLKETNKIDELEEIINKAKLDPLPEVRFAAMYDNDE